MADKWMQNVKSNGATRKRLGVKGDDKVSVSDLNKDIKKNQSKKQADGTLKPEAAKAIKQDVAAKNMMAARKKYTT